MLARVATFAIDGIDPRRVCAEVDIASGLPAFRIVGLGDAAVRESRERVRAALLNSGFDFPQRRITANLAPAHLRKVGPGFDLALAAGILAASGQVDRVALERWAVFGELSLSGELRGCRGVLTAAEGTRDAGLHGIVVPRSRAREAALVAGIEVAAVEDLQALVGILGGAAVPSLPPAPAQPGRGDDEADIADVRGHWQALQALEIAAGGGHHLLLEGHPGTGKTMLARRLPSILPDLSHDERLAVTRVHSVAGLHDGNGLIVQRPFRAPHHTTSAAGLTGGGSWPRPGEVTLAHHGVLFLDELSEFPRASLESLRQPLEDGRVTIVRGQVARSYPSRFLLVAATNPCPCGYLGDRRCTCSEADLSRHAKRLSGPLLDRIDMLVGVRRVSAEEIAAGPSRTSAAVRERVAAARERQVARLAGTGIVCNAHVGAALARTHLRATSAAQRLALDIYERSVLSTRGHARLMRVARTVADLEGRERIEEDDVLGALALRPQEPAVEAAA